MSKKMHVSKKLPGIVINSTLNDDWMKSLPGYKNEVAITEAALGGTPNKKKVKVVKKP